MMTKLQSSLSKEAAMLDYRYQTFLILTRYLNYTKAAQVLNLSQPTVTKHIQYLEDTLNTKLFHYNERHLQLTSQGEILRKGVLALNEQVAMIMAELDQNKAIRDFKVGVSRTIGEDYIHQHTCLFCERPNANIELLVENCATLFGMLHSKKIDFALISGPVSDPDLEKIPFYHDEIVAACSPRHHLANQDIPFSRLENERVLLREDGSGIANALKLYLPDASRSLNSLANLSRIGNNQLIKNFIMDNDGIGFFFKISIEAQLQDKTISLINVRELKIGQDFYLVYLKDTKTKEEVAQMLKIFAPEGNIKGWTAR